MGKDGGTISNELSGSATISRRSLRSPRTTGGGVARYAWTSTGGVPSAKNQRPAFRRGCLQQTHQELEAPNSAPTLPA